MSMIKKVIKEKLPEPLVNILRETYDGVGRLGDLPGAAFHPLRLESKKRLGVLKDKHRGERCFIIGNGPSLKNTDMGKLRNEYTIGMNRFFLAFPELGFKTSYFVSVNNLVIEQSVAELQSLEIPTFIAWRAHKWVKPSPWISYLYTTYTGPRFAQDVRGRLWDGATVTYTALQLAFHLGFQKVILIGVDHNFVTQGKANTTIVSQADDPNHFHPGYFAKGFRWQLPDLETSERSYTLARETYQQAGREVVDATVGGKLRVFSKVAYESLF